MTIPKLFENAYIFGADIRLSFGAHIYCKRTGAVLVNYSWHTPSLFVVLNRVDAL